MQVTVHRQCLAVMAVVVFKTRSALSPRGLLALARRVSVLLFAVLGVTAAQASPFAYITNAAAGTVSVIDTASNAVVATVPVGAAPFGVAVHPTNGRAYVANAADNTVSVLDTATHTVLTVVSVGAAPYGVAVDPLGGWVYVTNSGDHTVSVIQVSTNTVAHIVPVGAFPVQVALNPSGTRAYVTNLDGPSVSVIDTSTWNVVSTVAVGASPYGLVVDPSGNFVYVTTQYDSSVDVIDTALNAVVETIAMTGQAPNTIPIGIGVRPDGQRLYVALSDSNRLAVLDAVTRHEVAEIPVGVFPIGVAVHPLGTRVYVSNGNSDSVSVIDTSTNTVIATVPVGTAPYSPGMFIGPLSPYPDVSARMTVQGPFTAGSTVTYTLVLSNDGTQIQPDNPGDEYVNVLPSGLTLVSAMASSGTAMAAVGTHTVSWNGSIPGGQTVTLTIKAKIQPAAVGTEIPNQGTVHYDANMDGVNEASRLSDDPSISGPADPTVLTVAASPVAVPTLSEWATLTLALLMAVVGALRWRSRFLLRA